MSSSGELEVVAQRLRGLGHAPKLQTCFYALGFEWRSRKPNGYSKAFFNGRRLAIAGDAQRAIFTDSVTAGAVLHDCRKHWLGLCRLHHPDLGGDSDTMALLNGAWERIEVLFKRKGIRLD